MKEEKEEEFEELSNEKFADLLDELCELVELHPRNNLNLCLMGGMSEVLCLIFSHESDIVRRTACRVFTTVLTNNPEVQDYANRSGASYLTAQMEKEKTPQMRDALLGCLSQFLKSGNMEGKKRYIEQYDGLKQLSNWICRQGDEEKEMYGEGAILRKIKLKLRILLYDFALNDDSIIKTNPFHVRDAILNDAPLMKAIFESITNANLDVIQEVSLREYTLRILYRVYQRQPDLKKIIDIVLVNHNDKLQEAMKESEEKKEQFEDELNLVNQAYNAPKQEMEKNFDSTPTLIKSESTGSTGNAPTNPLKH